MTDLQTSLMAIGGAIVVGVITFNKWQEYKARKSVERAFSSTHDDVLMHPHGASPGTSNVRQEPNLAEERDDAAPSNGYAAPLTDESAKNEYAAAEYATDHYATDEYVSDEVQPQQRAPQQIELPVDAMIDCAIPLALAHRLDCADGPALRNGHRGRGGGGAAGLAQALSADGNRAWRRVRIAAGRRATGQSQQCVERARIFGTGHQIASNRGRS